MRKITFCLLLVLSVFFSAHSQVQVGYGQSTSAFLPLAYAGDYSYSQTIYLAEEIWSSGEIRTIQWKYTGSSPMGNSQNVDIYMGLTTRKDFPLKTDWIVKDFENNNLTKVYTGGFTTNSGPGWVTITLDTPFYYDGTHNLVIAVDENMPGKGVSSDKFEITTFTTGGARSIFYYSSTADVDPANPPTATGVQLNIPNIILGEIEQACLIPNTLTISNIQTQSATVNWLADAHTGVSEFYCSPSPEAPTESTPYTGYVESGNSAPIINLQAGTPYYVWVRHKCGEGDYGNWSAMTSFVTLCEQKTAFNENFDGVTAPKLPVCWSKILSGPSIGTTGAVVETTASADNSVLSSPNSVRIFASNADPINSKIILVSPSLSNLNSGLHRLKFYARHLSANGRIQIGTLNSTDTNAAFTLLPGYDDMVITTVSKEYTVDFSEYEGTDTYIGIRISTPTTYATVLLDNIRWELTPTCKDVIDLSTSIVTGDSAMVNWTPGGISESYDVAYGTTPSSDPDSQTIKNTVSAATSLKLTDLSGVTTYYVWVRSVCNHGEKGSWSSPVSFTTDCEAVATLRENFDGYTVIPNQQCCDILPNCWSKIIKGPTPFDAKWNYINTSSFINSQVSSSPNSVEMAKSYFDETTNDMILVSPTLSTLGSGTYRLKFSAKQNNIEPGKTGSLIIGTLDSASGNAKFTPYQPVILTTDVKEYIVDFTDHEVTDTHIGIKITSNNTLPTLVHIDDVIWEPSPTCVDVEQIKVPFTAATSATVSWVANGAEKKWQLSVGAIAVTDPNASSNIFVDATVDATGKTTKAVSGLTGGTSYKVWVRSNCDGDYGAWIGPVIFKTSCPAITAITENFDTTSGLPVCWAKILRGPNLGIMSDVSIFTNSTGSYAYSEKSSMQVLKGEIDDTGHNDVILVTPNLSNVYAGTHRLRFYAMRHPNGNPASIRVGSLNGNTNFSDFHPITGDIELNKTMTAYEFTFDPELGYTDTYIGITISSSNNASAYIDNFRWEPIPACPDPQNFIVKSTGPNSATFEWDPDSGVASWELANGPLSATDPDHITVTKYTTSDPVRTINELSVHTPYKVWIRSVCEFEGNGQWNGPFSYSTDCTPFSTLNEDVESADVPALLNCWTKILKGATLDPAAIVATVTGDAHSGSKSFVLRNNQSKEFDDLILVSPNLSTLKDGTHTLRFWAKTTGASIQVGTMDSNTKSANMTVIQEFTAPEGYVYTQYVVPFTTYRGSDPYIGIRMNTQKTSQFIYIDDITFDGNLSSDRFELSKLTYYPNPVNDLLTLSHLETIDSVAVYDVLGQQLKSVPVGTNTAQVDMSFLSKGTYMVKVSCGNSTETLKVLKL